MVIIRKSILLILFYFLNIPLVLCQSNILVGYSGYNFLTDASYPDEVQLKWRYGPSISYEYRIKIIKEYELVSLVSFTKYNSTSLRKNNPQDAWEKNHVKGNFEIVQVGLGISDIYHINDQNKLKIDVLYNYTEMFWGRYDYAYVEESGNLRPLEREDRFYQGKGKHISLIINYSNNRIRLVPYIKVGFVDSMHIFEYTNNGKREYNYHLQDRFELGLSYRLFGE